jgi:hypothetical protein
MAKKNKKKSTKGFIVIAGHTSPYLNYDVCVNTCGHIEDGIAFNFDKQGCWLVSYADLIGIAELAKQHRRVK